MARIPRWGKEISGPRCVYQGSGGDWIRVESPTLISLASTASAEQILGPMVWWDRDPLEPVVKKSGAEAGLPILHSPIFILQLSFYPIVSDAGQAALMEIGNWKCEIGKSR